jgi:hypothetical protein
LRVRAARKPKVRRSIGKVIAPTIMRAETNAAIWRIPAPRSRSIAARGKATKPGMRVVDPTRAARSTPQGPDSRPMRPTIASGRTAARIRPVTMITVRNSGRIIAKTRHARSRARAVR